MGFNLDIGPELVAHRFFKLGRGVVGGAERQRAVDFKVRGDGQASGNRLHGDVMDGEAAIARDHHHAFAHRLVVERARLGGDGEFGGRQFGADRGASAAP